MEKKVLTYMKEHHMLEQGDSVLAGVSGGADSVCLLFLLCQLQPLLGISIYVVHVNHSMRGVESDADEAYVESLCKQWGVHCQSVRVDMEGTARREKLSLEEAGRKLRYEVFYEKANEWGCKRIAVAHHADDQAETVLFQLFRGSGLKGLAAMMPVHGRIIRPLLCIERCEIEQYLKRQGISYQTDSTNFSNHYTRNKIRNQLLPFVKEQINEGAVRHLLQTAQVAREADIYLEQQAKSLFNKNAVQKDGGLAFPLCVLDSEPVLVGYILRYCIQKIGGSLRDITARHIEDIKKLAQRQSGRQISLPGSVIVKKQFKSLVFCQEASQASPGSGKEEVVAIDKVFVSSCANGLKVQKMGYKFEFRVFFNKKNELIPKKTYTKWLDYDKIKKVFFIRTRQPGDYLVINTQGGQKKLKNYLIDEKIPQDEREHLLLLADGAQIIWVVGHRISEAYKVTENTTTIMEIKVNGG